MTELNISSSLSDLSNVSMMNAPLDVRLPERMDILGNMVNGVNIPRTTINAPSFNSTQYLRHCDNGLQALMEKHAIADARSMLPTGEIRAQNKYNACRQLDIQLPEVAPTSLEELPNGHLKEMLENIVQGMSMQPPDTSGMNELQRDEALVNHERTKVALAYQMLVNGLETDNLNHAIADESCIQTIENEHVHNEHVHWGGDLCEQAAAKIRRNFQKRITDILNAPETDSMSRTELAIRLEQENYSVSNARDMLKITTSALLYHRNVMNAVDNAVLRAEFESVLSAETVPREGDTNDVALEKMAKIRNHFKAMRKALDSVIKSNQSVEVTQLAMECRQFINGLSMQMEATAKLSLKEKLREAQAQRVQNRFEQGGSDYATVHIEVGPEFSLLKALSLGVKLQFTYTYAVNVDYPFGPINVMNSFQGGINVEGIFGVEDDPLSGKVKFLGHGDFMRLKRYNSPDEMLDAESNNLVKQLMHYAQPPAIPKKTDRGVRAGLRAFGNNAVNFFKSIGYAIASLFKRPGEAAKKALMENETFVESLRQKGVFGHFDSLRQSSVNRKFYTEITSKGFGGGLGGKVNFGEKKHLAFLKSIEGRIEYNYRKTTTTMYKGVLTQLGNSEFELANFVKKEYQQYADKATRKMKQDFEEFNHSLQGRNPTPNGLLQRVCELSGEFDWFCAETNHDDLTKKGLHSSRSENRRNLMASRSVDDRGEYLRALMTRCASLKLQSLRVSTEGLDEEGLEQLALCRKLLDKLSGSLEEPPVILSKKNLLYLKQKDIKKTGAHIVDIEVQVKGASLFKVDADKLGGARKVFKNEDNSESTDIKALVKITEPTVKQGYFKNHGKTEISFSVTGDMLLQYGPQLVSNIMRAVAEKGVVNNEGKDGGGAGTVAKETLKDYIENVAYDMASMEVNSAIKDTLESHQVSIVDQDGNGHDKKDVNLGSLIKAGLSHINTFTVTVTLNGSENGIKYGGVNITNSRGLKLWAKGSVPVTANISVGGEAYLMTGSTELVYRTFGTNTFGPLCEIVFNLGEALGGLELFAKKHKNALQTMTNNCLTDGTKLNQELKGVIGAVSQRAERFQQDMDTDNNPRIGFAGFRKAKQFAYLSLSLINSLKYLPNGGEFVDTEEVQQLKNKAIDILVKTRVLDASNRTEEEIRAEVGQAVAEILDKPLEPLPNDAASIINLARNIKLLDTLM